MQVPIWKEGEYLFASLLTGLSDVEFLHFYDNLIHQVTVHKPKGVIVDASYVDILDSYATRMLNEMAVGVKKEGGMIVVIGLRSDVFSAMNQLGLNLKIESVPTVKEALTKLNHQYDDTMKSNG